MSQSQYFHTIYHAPQVGPKEKITLVPFSDVHRDTENCCVTAWKLFCKTEAEAIANGQSRLYLGVGDYLDFMSDSERASYRCGNHHESSIMSIEKMVRSSCDAFVKEIEFMRGKLIGLLEGNHYFLFANGSTSTQYMCEKLGCKYLGGVATIRLYLDFGNRITYAVDILASHYGTGGRLLGSALNSLDNMIKVASMDIYIQGHSHKIISHKDAKPLFINGKGVLKAREMVLCNPGSYLLGYVDGKESYPVKTVMRPVSVGQVYIEMENKYQSRNGEEDRFVTFNVIRK